MARVAMVEAVTMALAWELENDPSVVILGEDVGVNGGVFRATAGLAQQCGDARNSLPGSQSHQALLHQDAIIVVERNDVGDRAECDKIEVASWNLRRTGLTLLLQHSPDSGHEVKRDTDTRQIATRKLTAFQIGIDDDSSRWQLAAWQMVVGDQHLYTELIGTRDAVNAGYTVVDRYDKTWRTSRRDIDDLWCQAIAKIEAVGYQVLDVIKSELSQAP